MLTKYFVFGLTLWSCIATAGFSVVDKSYVVDGQPLEIKNMPRQRSQGPANDCWGFCAATIAQFNICKRPNPPPECDKTPPESEISPLSMVAWTHTNTDKGGVAEARNHKNLQFGLKGSTAAKALKTAREQFMFLAEACFPHDLLATKFGENGDKDVAEAFSIIEKEYKRSHTEGRFCEECLTGAATNVGIKLPDDFKSLMKSKKTYGEFLYGITLGKCEHAIDGSPSPQFDMFPPASANYSQMISKIKEVLSTGNPLAFDGICFEYDGKECKTSHSVVISGYRKVCNGQTCRDVLKIQNSWGKDWQKQYDDGWVSAEDLLSDVTKHPNLSKNTLSWYF